VNDDAPHAAELGRCENCRAELARKTISPIRRGDVYACEFGVE
jgi:hypothetical protein